MRSSWPARRSVSSSCVQSDLALKAWRAVVWFLSPRVAMAWISKVRVGCRARRAVVTMEVWARARAERRVPMWMVGVGVVGEGEEGVGREGEGEVAIVGGDGGMTVSA